MAAFIFIMRWGNMAKYQILQNGEVVNTITGSATTVQAYAQRNGYVAELIKESLTTEEQIGEIRQKQQELQETLDILLGVQENE